MLENREDRLLEKDILFWKIKDYTCIVNKLLFCVGGSLEKCSKSSDRMQIAGMGLRNASHMCLWILAVVIPCRHPIHCYQNERCNRSLKMCVKLFLSVKRRLLNLQAKKIFGFFLLQKALLSTRFPISPLLRHIRFFSIGFGSMDWG